MDETPASDGTGSRARPRRPLGAAERRHRSRHCRHSDQCGDAEVARCPRRPACWPGGTPAGRGKGSHRAGHGGGQDRPRHGREGRGRSRRRAGRPVQARVRLHRLPRSDPGRPGVTGRGCASRRAGDVRCQIPAQVDGLCRSQVPGSRPADREARAEGPRLRRLRHRPRLPGPGPHLQPRQPRPAQDAQLHPRPARAGTVPRIWKR